MNRKREVTTAETISEYTYHNDDVGRRTAVENTGAAFSDDAFTLWGYNTRSELTLDTPLRLRRDRSAISPLAAGAACQGLTSSKRGQGSTVQDPPTTEVTAERRLYNYDPIGHP